MPVWRFLLHYVVGAILMKPSAKKYITGQDLA